MAQDPTQLADGQEKKIPQPGDLIVLPDGRPLIILGRPRLEPVEMGLIRMLEGALVVLTPGGSPALYMPDVHPSRPLFIEPWEWDWEPIPSTPPDPPADGQNQKAPGEASARGKLGRG